MGFARTFLGRRASVRQMAHVAVFAAQMTIANSQWHICTAFSQAQGEHTPVQSTHLTLYL